MALAAGFDPDDLQPFELRRVCPEERLCDRYCSTPDGVVPNVTRQWRDGSPSVTLTPMLKLLLSYSSHCISAEHVAVVAKRHLHVPASRRVIVLRTIRYV